MGLARQVSPAPFPQTGSRSRSRAGPVGTRCFLRALGLLLRASLPLSPGTEPRKGGGGSHLPAGPPRGGPGRAAAGPLLVLLYPSLPGCGGWACGSPRGGKARRGTCGAGSVLGEKRGAVPGVGARAPGREDGRGTGAGRRRLGAIRPRAGSSPRNRPPTAARGSRLPTPEPRRRLRSPPVPRRRGGPKPGPDA